MNKFLELLEAHCQWIAVGIGGLFLAWMLWSYILMQPVAVEGPGNTLLTPGNVDDVVQRSYAEPLRQELQRQTDEKPPQQGQASVMPPWTRAMTGQERPAVALNDNWSGSLPMQMPDWDQFSAPSPVQTELVKALPEVPPTVPSSAKAARATVSEAPAAAPGQPAQPQPGMPNAAVQPVAGRDINYVFYQYRISASDLADSFRAAGIPAGQTTTSILAVKTYRQEQLPNGEWSKAIEITPIKSAPPTYPVPANAVPESPEAVNFLSWAESPTGQADLLRPPFYTVLAGEGPWDQPLELPVFDPEAERQERLRILREQREQQLRDRANRATPQPRPEEMMPEEMEPPRRGRRGRPQASDPQRPGRYDELVGRQLAQFPPQPGPGQVFGLPEEMGMPPEDMQQPQQPGAGQPNVSGLPEARFDPMQNVAVNFDGWIYDESISEGKTYRYQVVYAIRNPLFGTQGIGAKGLESTFAIWSNKGQPDEDAWSAPVAVEATTEFFLATNNNWSANSMPSQVNWEIFKWSDGRWQKTTRTASVGDRIGGVDTVGAANKKTDFSTGAVVVDIRYDPKLNRSYVLVLDHTGALRELGAVEERDNPRRRQLQAATAAPVEAAADGRTFGGPAMAR